MGGELHELAWHCDYPIVSSLGWGSFLEAFMDYGCKVSVSNKRMKANFNLFYSSNDNPRFLESSLSYDEILIGWENSRHPKGSPHALYDSICIVFDKMGEIFDNSSREEKNDWWKFRDSETKNVRKKMESYLLPYFKRYQEHILVPTSGKTPILEEPNIISRVIKNFPMLMFEKAIERSRDPRRSNNVCLTPCPETLLEHDLVNDFDEDYYPSESAIVDFFIGNYLYELHLEKGYPFWNNSDDILRDLVVQSYRAFKSGSMVNFSIT
jgi:hypothetical protein